MLALIVSMSFIFDGRTPPAPKPILTDLAPPIGNATLLPTTETNSLYLHLLMDRLELPIMIVLVLPETHITQTVIFFAGCTLKVKTFQSLLLATTTSQVF